MTSSNKQEYTSLVKENQLRYDCESRILKTSYSYTSDSDFGDYTKNRLKVQRKERQINFPGCMILFILGLSSMFYLGLRIYSIQFMDKHIWFAIYSLIGEATLISSNVWYCLYLLFQLKPIKHVCMETESQITYKHKYVVYVLVPCYKEPLEVITKTIMSILSARSGFEMTDILIYLCDDGNDPEKERYIKEDLGNEYGVFYISGRVKPRDQINGKSENINNALKNYIFKDGRWEHPERISFGELICVFDADQCPSRDFFRKMLPRMNISDDTALVLSPQKFNNVDPWSDIFNHYNIHFWHYIMSSLCSFDTIFCTGTNFLLRARALAEVGMFPTKSITEDFELGIYLTIRKWKYEYIYEYLAVGDAPSSIRNIYQQRSRWSKGAFQILWRRPAENPFMAPGLSLYQRMLYVCGLYSYFADFVSTPILFSIPILAIWLKVFPYIITKKLVITLTVMAFTTKLTGVYSNNIKNMMLMQYAVICHYLMWFVYFKAFWRTLFFAITGKKLSFKATKKNDASKGFNLSLKDTWVFIIMWLIGALTLCFVFIKGILYKKYVDGDIKLPFWMFYYLPNMYHLDEYDIIDILWCWLNLSIISMLFLYMIFKNNKILMRVFSIGCVSQQIIIPIAFLIILWDLTNKDFFTERAKIPNGKSKLYKLNTDALAKSDDILAGISMEQFNSFDLTYQEFIDQTQTSFAIRQIFVKFPFELYETNEEEKMTTFLTECAEQQIVCTLSVEPFKGLNSYTRKEVVRLANQIKIYGIPIILRFAHEMNSNWYPWSQRGLLFQERFEEMSDIMKEYAPNVGMMISYQESLGYPFVSPDSEFYPKNNTAETLREYKNQDTNGDGLITSEDDAYLPFTPRRDSFQFIGASMYHWGQTINAIPSFNVLPAKGYAYSRLYDIHQLAKKWNKQFIISEQGALYIKNNQRELTDQMKRKGFEQVSEAEIKKAWFEQIYEDLPKRFEMMKGALLFEIEKEEMWHKDACDFYKSTVFRNVDCEDPSQYTVDWTMHQNPKVAEAYRGVVNPNNDIIKGNVKNLYFTELSMSL